MFWVPMPNPQGQKHLRQHDVDLKLDSRPGAMLDLIPCSVQHFFQHKQTLEKSSISRVRHPSQLLAAGGHLAPAC